MSSVRIVNVIDADYENLPSFKIGLKDFIEIVDESDHSIVFNGAVQYRVEDAFFVVHRGVALYTEFVSVKTWDEFKSEYKKMNKGQFKNHSDFSDAFEYGIKTNKLYQEFVNSEYYRANDCRYAQSDQKKGH